MKTYLIYLLLCNATCQPLPPISVSGAHNARQATSKAIEQASHCYAPADNDTQAVRVPCPAGYLKLARAELQRDAPKLHH